MTTEVTRHGITWIYDGDAVCPECEMLCTVEHLAEGIAEEDDTSGMEIISMLVARFDCPKCRCLFKISRDE